MPEFLRCGGFYFAVAVHHSQLHVRETLLKNKEVSSVAKHRTVKSLYSHKTVFCCICSICSIFLPGRTLSSLYKCVYVHKFRRQCCFLKASIAQHPFVLCWQASGTLEAIHKGQRGGPLRKSNKGLPVKRSSLFLQYSSVVMCHKLSSKSV